MSSISMMTMSQAAPILVDLAIERAEAFASRLTPLVRTALSAVVVEPTIEERLRAARKKVRWALDPDAALPTLARMLKDVQHRVDDPWLACYTREEVIRLWEAYLLRMRERTLAERHYAEQVHTLGLRPLDAEWADPEVQAIADEMLHKMDESADQLLELEGLSAPRLLFYLRPPLASDQTWLVAAWYAGGSEPRLLKQVGSPNVALHEMQQVWRAAVLTRYVCGDDIYIA